MLSRAKNGKPKNKDTWKESLFVQRKTSQKERLRMWKTPTTRAAIDTEKTVCDATDHWTEDDWGQGQTAFLLV